MSLSLQKLPKGGHRITARHAGLALSLSAGAAVFAVIGMGLGPDGAPWPFINFALAAALALFAALRLPTQSVIDFDVATHLVSIQHKALLRSTRQEVALAEVTDITHTFQSVAKTHKTEYTGGIAGTQIGGDGKPIKRHVYQMLLHRMDASPLACFAVSLRSPDVPQVASNLDQWIKLAQSLPPGTDPRGG
jgi:hypothetical protein